MENDNQDNIIEIGYQPYIKKKYFFSLSELKFYEVLKEIVGDQYLLFSKVRVSDLIEPKYGKERHSYFNKIKSKHVDFLICDKDPISPRVAIELDGSSHNRPSRQERDDFIDEAFANANIPVVHIRVKSEYDPNEIIEKIENACQNKYVVKKDEEEKSIANFISLLVAIFIFLLFFLVLQKLF